MKNLAKFMLLAALVAAPAFSFAQSDAHKSNEELSQQYKYEIDALESELKANKKHQKANPGDATLKAEEQTKKAQLATLKEKKKAVDKAISTEKKNVKAQKKSQDAQENAEKAIAKAKAANEAAKKAVGDANPEGKSWEQLSDQYKHEIDALEAEIKANKSRQKAIPSDATLKTEEQNKKAQLATLKERKKAVDAAVSAEKASQNAQKKADNRQEDAEEALQKAKSQAKAADRAVGR